jgi:hypothetical protein
VLAERLAQQNAEWIREVAWLSDEQWQTWCAAQGRALGEVVQQVATTYRAMAEGRRAGNRGRPAAKGCARMPATPGLDAPGAPDDAAPAKAAVLEALRRNGAAAACAVRGLTDEELDPAAPAAWAAGAAGAPATTAQAVERVLLGRLARWLEDVRSTVGA